MPVFAQQSDTVEHYLMHDEKPCDPANSFYYRLGIKDGMLWKVKQFYISTQTKQMEGYFSKYGNDTFEIRQGSFIYFHENGKVWKKVRYINDLKDGIAKEYSEDGRLTDSGYYKQGIPYKVHYGWYNDGAIRFKGIYDSVATGIGEEWAYFNNGKLSSYRKTKAGYLTDSVWIYYHENGKVSCIESYGKDSIEKMECFNEDGKAAPKEYTAHELLPVSNIDFNKHLMKNLRYPKDAIENNTEGTVYVKFYVDTDGSVIDVTTIGRKLGMGCDEEAIRVIKAMPKWTPGRDHNRLVKIYFTQAVTFRLE